MYGKGSRKTTIKVGHSVDDLLARLINFHAMNEERLLKVRRHSHNYYIRQVKNPPFLCTDTRVQK